MVRRMPKQSAARSPAELNRIFQALADPTRRAVLERLGKGPASMGDLAQPFDMALPSFAQHLDVLENCGLVRSTKTGRVRTYELQAQTLGEAEHWLARQRIFWGRRLDQLDNYLETMKKEQKT